ncbi:hypothetical protein [Paraburkholderia sartisoli]|uniref:Uncharacterized protein n=1 Tax=Paraburkholderia sartisoli TaxID=83784 RepID=A0A1H4ECG8_9BURK|nr:hypothetical protein [Paraburkholderia sartisoli]SEA81982.1 hypothetical protein SAMN05192564_103225 [Paraburkholderia sartisoli]
MNPDSELASAEPGDSAAGTSSVPSGLFEAAGHKKGTRLSTSLALGFARLFGLELFLTDIVTPHPATSPDPTISLDQER